MDYSFDEFTDILLVY
nr:unnamed protein product [Callosobruchus analis]